MAEHHRPELLLRYPAGARMAHWLVAVAFAFATASGFAFFHPSLFFLSNLLGGGPWSALLHPFVGLAMAVALYVLARPLIRDNRLEPSDQQWLRGFRHVLRNEEDKLPEVGRYNAGQKLMFYAQTVSVAVLLVTGIVIWRLYFSGFFPVGLIRLSVLLHALAAFVLACAVITHVAAGLWVKGSVGAMTRGTVTHGWAWKHHRAWFRQMIRPTGGR